jgi:hypothetical protein
MHEPLTETTGRRGKIMGSTAYSRSVSIMVLVLEAVCWYMD